MVGREERLSVARRALETLRAALAVERRGETETNPSERGAMADWQDVQVLDGGGSRGMARCGRCSAGLGVAGTSARARRPAA